MTAFPATTGVKYRFVAVHRIVGFSDLPTTSEPLAVREMALNLSVPNVFVKLTVDPNPALTEIDRGVAMGHLMWHGFLGLSAPGDILKAVHDYAAGLAQERLKKFGTGAYLVLEARGDLTSTQTDAARDFDEAVLAFDAVDKKALKAKHAHLVSAALAAVALSVDRTTDIDNVADGIALILPDGRPLYSVTITGGNANLITARPATANDAHAIERAMAALIGDKRLVTPSRLLVDALRSSTDRLEAFIFAWAGLDAVIRKFTADCETGKWLSKVPEEYRAAAAALHREYVDQGHRHYSLAQMARTFALCHKMGSGEDLAADITRLKNAYREPIYHQGSIADWLPVEAVTALLRQVIDAAVNSD